MSSEDQRRRTVPSERTRAEEARDARVPSGDAAASREPDEPESTPPPEVDDEVAEHYREMIDRGAHQEGEGRLP